MCKNFPRRLGTEAAGNDLVLCQRAWAPVLSAPLLWTTRRLKWDFRHSRVVLKNEPSESPSSAHGVPRPRRPGKEYGTEETTREREAGTAHLVTKMWRTCQTKERSLGLGVARRCQKTPATSLAHTTSTSPQSQPQSVKTCWNLSLLLLASLPIGGSGSIGAHRKTACRPPDQNSSR